MKNASAYGHGDGWRTFREDVRGPFWEPWGSRELILSYFELLGGLGVDLGFSFGSFPALGTRDAAQEAPEWPPLYKGAVGRLAFGRLRPGLGPSWRPG